MLPTDADEVMAASAVADNVGRTFVAPPDLAMVGEPTTTQGDQAGNEGLCGEGGGAGPCDERRESLTPPTDAMESETIGSGEKEEPQVGVTSEPPTGYHSRSLLRIHSGGSRRGNDPDDFHFELIGGREQVRIQF